MFLSPYLNYPINQIKRNTFRLESVSSAIFHFSFFILHFSFFISISSASIAAHAGLNPLLNPLRIDRTFDQAAA